MVNTILFDMDGVICDTNPFHSKAFRQFFHKRNIFPSDRDFALHMYGKSNRYIMSYFLDRPIEDDELVELEYEKESLFREIYADHIKAIDGFMDFLSFLKSQEYKLGVATSAPKANMDLILRGLGIENWFGSKMSSENVTHHKPHPQVYIESAQILSSPVQECLVFEDSHSGITAATSAGMKVIGVLTSHSISELPSCAHYIEKFDIEELIPHINIRN